MRSRLLATLVVMMALVVGACAGPPAQTTAPTSPGDTPPAGTPATTPAVTDPAPTDEPAGGGTLRVIQVQDPLGFDPTQFATGNHTFMYNMYDTLVRVGEDGLPQPRLAESWTVSDDGLTITLTLRQGATFHDGRTITADDVVFSYDYTTDPENGTNLEGRLKAVIETIEAPDAQTVVFNMLRPAPGFFDLMDVFFILNQDKIDTILEEGAGSGPFMFGDRSPGESYSLVRYDEYWEEGVPILERLEFQIISDPEAQLNALMTFAADMIYQGSPVLAQHVEATPGFRVDQLGLGANTLYLAINVTREPFTNPLVRQAIAHATDRETLMRVTYPGDTAVTACQPFPPTSFFHTEGLDAELETCRFDLDRARDLLTEAGFPDGFSTTVNVSQNYGPPGSPDMALLLQQDLAEIGIDLEVLVIEGAEAREKLLSSDFDMVIHTYSASGADPGFNHPSRTFGPVSNSFPAVTAEDFPEYNDIVSAAGSELDRDLRKEMYADMSRILTEEAFINLLGYTYVLFLASENVDGLADAYHISAYPDFSLAYRTDN